MEFDSFVESRVMQTGKYGENIDLNAPNVLNLNKIAWIDCVYHFQTHYMFPSTQFVKKKSLV